MRNWNVDFLSYCRYNNWNLDGIFFDEVNGIGAAEQVTTLPMYQRYATAVKAKSETAKTDMVIFNFGANGMVDGNLHDNAWVEPCDICLMYENDYQNANNPWDSYTPLPAAMNWPKSKFASMFRSVGQAASVASESGGDSTYTQ